MRLEVFGGSMGPWAGVSLRTGWVSPGGLKPGSPVPLAGLSSWAPAAPLISPPSQMETRFRLAPGLRACGCFSGLGPTWGSCHVTQTGVDRRCHVPGPGGGMAQQGF